MNRGRDNALWRDEFPIEAGEERYVTRRQFARFLVLTSVGMFVGQIWILATSWLKRAPAFPEARIAAAGEVPVGASKVFFYPTESDPCLLIRTGPDTWVAYGQKCTHLSCAVFWSPASGRIECPCHNGAFSARDGRVLQGPPPRPLPRIRVERRGDAIVALGAADGGEV